MNSVLEFSGLHCCLIVKVQARQIVVQSFWKACFHKMYCAMRCCATALSEQCFLQAVLASVLLRFVCVTRNDVYYIILPNDCQH